MTAALLLVLGVLQGGAPRPIAFTHVSLIDGTDSLQDSLGTIAPGKLADLVLLDADPLADIRNTRRINAVVANGRLLDSAARKALLH